ncbi:hypothetical protein DFH09DRAFT_1299918 [Mycena vulgaris]|nr:hypothetical protein DFH09DRAFT_1299918 [Mycena vulgaris]
MHISASDAAGTCALTLQWGILPYMPELRPLSFSCRFPSSILETLTHLPEWQWDSIEAYLLILHADSEVQWRAIDNVLAEPRFSSLRRFSITWSGRPVIRPALMPLACARGILNEKRGGVGP